MPVAQKKKRPRVVISQALPVQYVLDQHDPPFAEAKQPKRERPDIIGEAEARHEKVARRNASILEKAIAARSDEEHALSELAYRNKFRASQYLADMERARRSARKAAARWLRKSLKK